jgi:hypothetical protein
MQCAQIDGGEGGGGGRARDSSARRTRSASTIARASAANVVRDVLSRPWRAWNSLVPLLRLAFEMAFWTVALVRRLAWAYR